MRLRDALGRRVRRIRPRGGGSPGGCRDSSIGAKSGGGGGDVSGTRLVEYGLDPPGAGELLAGGGAHLEVEVLDDPDEVRPRDGVVRALLLEVAHREGCACEGTERRGGGVCTSRLEVAHSQGRPSPVRVVHHGIAVSQRDTAVSARVTPRYSKTSGGAPLFVRKEFGSRRRRRHRRQRRRRQVCGING